MTTQIKDIPNYLVREVIDYIWEADPTLYIVDENLKLYTTEDVIDTLYAQPPREKD